MLIITATDRNPTARAKQFPFYQDPVTVNIKNKAKLKSKTD